MKRDFCFYFLLMLFSAHALCQESVKWGNSFKPRLKMTYLYDYFFDSGGQIYVIGAGTNIEQCVLLAFNGDLNNTMRVKAKKKYLGMYYFGDVFFINGNFLLFRNKGDYHVCTSIGSNGSIISDRQKIIRNSILKPLVERHNVIKTYSRDSKSLIILKRVNKKSKDFELDVAEINEKADIIREKKIRITSDSIDFSGHSLQAAQFEDNNLMLVTGIDKFSLVEVNYTKSYIGNSIRYSIENNNYTISQPLKIPVKGGFATQLAFHDSLVFYCGLTTDKNRKNVTGAYTSVFNSRTGKEIKYLQKDFSKKFLLSFLSSHEYSMNKGINTKLFQQYSIHVNHRGNVLYSFRGLKTNIGVNMKYKFTDWGGVFFDLSNDSIHEKNIPLNHIIDYSKPQFYNIFEKDSNFYCLYLDVTELRNKDRFRDVSRRRNTSLHLMKIDGKTGETLYDKIIYNNDNDIQILPALCFFDENENALYAVGLIRKKAKLGKFSVQLE